MKLMLRTREFAYESAATHLAVIDCKAPPKSVSVECLVTPSKEMHTDEWNTAFC